MIQGVVRVSLVGLKGLGVGGSSSSYQALFSGVGVLQEGRGGVSGARWLAYATGQCLVGYGSLQAIFLRIRVSLRGSSLFLGCYLRVKFVVPGLCRVPVLHSSIEFHHSERVRYFRCIYLSLDVIAMRGVYFQVGNRVWWVVVSMVFRLWELSCRGFPTVALWRRQRGLSRIVLRIFWLFFGFCFVSVGEDYVTQVGLSSTSHVGFSICGGGPILGCILDLGAAFGWPNYLRHLARFGRFVLETRFSCFRFLSLLGWFLSIFLVFVFHLGFLGVFGLLVF